MKLSKRVTVAAAGALAVAALAGCSVAEPDSSQVVLHYTGGPFSSQNFESCVPNGVRDVGGPGDYNFYYPNGRRTYTFNDDPAADQKSIGVNTKDVQMVGRGQIAFRLNTDCIPYTDSKGAFWPGGRFQKFHDTIGRQNVAYAEAGGVPQPDGWRNVLRTYLGQAAERAMDQAAQAYPSASLYNDPVAVSAWDAKVTEELPKRIQEATGDDLFVIEEVQLNRPDLPQNLQDERNNREGAVLRQQAAEIDRKAAESFPGGLPGYLQREQQQAVNEAIKSGKVQVLPIPQGSPVIVSPR